MKPVIDTADILLVDDAPGNLLALEAILRRPDYRILAAVSAEEALDHLRTREFAVMLLDVRMPGMSGFDLARQSRVEGINRDTPIIFVTGAAGDVPQIGEGFLLGASDYLVKPLDATEVRAKVSVLVDLYRSKRRLSRLNLEREHRLRAIADSVPALVYYVDKEHRCQFMNETYQDWFDVPPAEVVGKPLSEVLGKDIYEHTRPQLDAAFHREDATYEIEFPRRAGGVRFGRGSYNPDRYAGDGDSVAGVVGLISDITAQKDVELALRESRAQTQRAAEATRKSEAQFRTLSNTIPQLAWMTDEHGWIFWYNDRWYDYTGTTLEEVQGWGWKKVHHPEHVDRVVTEFTRCLLSGEPWEDTFPLRAKNGEWRWFLSRASPLRNDQGQITSWFGTNTDITDQRLAQEAVARLAAIVASSDDAIVAKTLDSTITSWNAAAERMFGYTEAEAIGRSITMLMPPERIGEEATILASIQRGVRIEHFETVRKRKDGRLIDVSLSISPVRDNLGRIIGIAKIARDISQQKLAQQEVRQAKEAAEAANQAKSAFLANMSHEIRTPLNAILGFTELLIEPDLPPADRQTYATTIRRNSRLLSRLIDDILDISKIEAGKLMVERLSYSLPVLLADVKAMFERLAREKGLHFTVQSEGKVPERITCDPTRLKQILVNLIGNAVKFTSEGGVDVTVTMSPGRSEAPGSKLLFLVKDTGIGISEEQRARLFAPFTQADASTTRRYGGTGLGLILSRRLAQALGGTVELTSSVTGGGSTFKIEIDPNPTSGETVISGVDLSSGRPSLVAASQRPRRLDGMKILVGEDAADSRLLIGRYLVREGASAEFANDGVEVVDKALGGDFDVVLMDLSMPRRDGFAATKELRRQGYDRPIIAVSANVMAEHRIDTERAGCDAHIGKPLDIDELVDRLLAIGQKQASR